MKAYYDLMTTIQTLLLAEPDCNTVIRPQDLGESKRDLFPLCTAAAVQAGTINGAARFQVVIEAVDIVDENKETPADKFVQVDDFHDIMNAQLYVLVRFFKILDKQTAGYSIEQQGSFEALYKESTPVVCGWRGTFNITLALGDVTSC